MSTSAPPTTPASPVDTPLPELEEEGGPSTPTVSAAVIAATGMTRAEYAKKWRENHPDYMKKWAQTRDKTRHSKLTEEEKRERHREASRRWAAKNAQNRAYVKAYLHCGQPLLRLRNRAFRP